MIKPMVVPCNGGCTTAEVSVGAAPEMALAFAASAAA